MQFMDPKYDVAFKKLFGDQRHAEITISFLNAVLERTGGDEILSITIIDPYNHPNAEGQKLSVVDVRCVDKNGFQYIVEMQVIDKSNFIERSQYYTAMALANQLTSGADYKEVKPVVFVGVVNFDIDPSPHYLNHHYITNSATYQRILRHMEFHFIELPKFKKTEAELVTVVDKWTYFLKQADRLTDIPAPLAAQTMIFEAFQLLKRHNWSEQEHWAYLHYLEAINAERDLKRAGFFEGKEKGFTEGKTEGKAEGRVEGERKKAYEIARGLLDILDVKTIAQKTGLTEGEVSALRDERRGNQVTM